MIVAPEPVSRLVSTITLAPSAIACSACACCVAASPSAFTMLKSSPFDEASSLERVREGRRSSPSQRSDEAVSGSSTQIGPPLFAEPVVSPVVDVSAAVVVAATRRGDEPEYGDHHQDRTDVRCMDPPSLRARLEPSADLPRDN